MKTAAASVEFDAPIATWFGVGGRADRLARPGSVEELRALLEGHDASTGEVRVLGDGANLLVADEGVDGLVVDLKKMNALEWGEAGVVAGAGASLQKVVAEACRRGLGGVEGLGGVPASMGGAARMNAGGAFGEIGDVIAGVRVVDERGIAHQLTRAELEFGYRRSNLGGLVVVGVELALTPEDPQALRKRLKEVMAHKKDAQPLAAKSAGCVFKNPEVDGARVSAGRLIDKAGLKGERVGGASVSERHGNFVIVEGGATATDALRLIGLVRERVREDVGIELEQELVVWERGVSDE